MKCDQAMASLADARGKQRFRRSEYPFQLSAGPVRQRRRAIASRTSRWQGYPRGLAGDAIPDMALIINICDALDAMISHRPYRLGMPRDKAIAIIREFRAAPFDAHYADVFIALGMAGHLNQVMGHSDDGIPLQSCSICGPTLMVQREHKEGDHLYCRNCSREFALKTHDNVLAAVPTGKQGQAVDLEPAADTALITRAVRASVEALSITNLMRVSAMPLGNGR